jgi:hypothetical protein
MYDSESNGKHIDVFDMTIDCWGSRINYLQMDNHDPYTTLEEFKIDDLEMMIATFKAQVIF